MGSFFIGVICNGSDWTAWEIANIDSDFILVRKGKSKNQAVFRTSWWNDRAKNKARHHHRYRHHSPFHSIILSDMKSFVSIHVFPEDLPIVKIIMALPYFFILTSHPDSVNRTRASATNYYVVSVQNCLVFFVIPAHAGIQLAKIAWKPGSRPSPGWQKILFVQFWTDTM